MPSPTVSPLPNYLHIGGAKCKSSWLWRVCQEHPDIYVPAKPDNVNFFTQLYHRGIDWYRDSFFSAYAGQPVIGEFSNSYLVYEPAIQRIVQDIPDIRCSVTIRNPVDASFLAWAHMHLKTKKYGFDPARGIGIPFEKILTVHGHVWFRAFCEPAMYAWKLRRLFQYIPAERVHVQLYDDLVADQAAFLHAYFSFLGVDPDFRPAHKHTQVNPDPSAGLLAPDLRRELTEMFRSDIEDLQLLLGRDLSPWLSGEWQGFQDEFPPPHPA